MSARTCSSAIVHARDPYCAVVISSFVMPAVSAAVIVSTTDQSPITQSRSSNLITPRAFRCSRIHGSTCFWPLSAMPAHHRSPSTRARSQSRIAGFCPLFSETYPSRSLQKCENSRRFSPRSPAAVRGLSGGGVHECDQIHGSHTRDDRPCPRILFWSVKSLPAHLLYSHVRGDE